VALDEAALDNTDVVRDHSFHCIASAESWRPRSSYACGVNRFNLPDAAALIWGALLPENVIMD
jgi:hypothetical protein